MRRPTKGLSHKSQMSRALQHKPPGRGRSVKTECKRGKVDFCSLARSLTLPFFPLNGYGCSPSLTARRHSSSATVFRTRGTVWSSWLQAGISLGKKSPQRGGQCAVNAAGNEARPSFSSFVFLHKNLYRRVCSPPPFQLPVAAAQTQVKLNSQPSHRGCLTAVRNVNGQSVRSQSVAVLPLSILMMAVIAILNLAIFSFCRYNNFTQTG